jgi:hypothetical protein
MFLHAYRLAFRHPTTGHRMEFKAEPTRPLAEPLERLAALTQKIRGSSGGRRR